MIRPRSAQPVALDYEITQEQANALGRAGRALEAALAALSEHDRTPQCGGHARAKLVQDAGDALWRLGIQRGGCGFRGARGVLRDYWGPPKGEKRMGGGRQNDWRARQSARRGARPRQRGGAGGGGGGRQRCGLVGGRDDGVLRGRRRRRDLLKNFRVGGLQLGDFPCHLVLTGGELLDALL